MKELLNDLNSHINEAIALARDPIRHHQRLSKYLACGMSDEIIKAKKRFEITNELNEIFKEISESYSVEVNRRYRDLPIAEIQQIELRHLFNAKDKLNKLMKDHKIKESNTMIISKENYNEMCKIFDSLVEYIDRIEDHLIEWLNGHFKVIPMMKFDIITHELIPMMKFDVIAHALIQLQDALSNDNQAFNKLEDVISSVKFLHVDFVNECRAGSEKAISMLQKQKKIILDDISEISNELRVSK